MLFDIIEYKDITITWDEFLNYLEELKKEETLRDEYEIKFRKSDEYQKNKDKYERVLRLGNFQFKTIFDNIYNKKNKILEKRLFKLEITTIALSCISATLLYFTFVK